MEKERTEFTVTIGGVVKVLAVFAVAAALYKIRDFVLILLTSVVIASALEPFTRRLVGFGVPRIISVISLFLLFIIAFFAVLFFFVPPLLTEFSNFVASLPEYVGSVEGLDSTIDSLFGAQNLLNDITSNFSIVDLLSDARAALFGISGGALQAISLFFGGITGVVLILVISFYLAVQEKGIENFLRVVVPLRHEKYALDLWKRTQNKIALWMQGQLLLGLLIGVLVYLGLTVLGVKYAFLLALVAAVFELIPVVGPIMGAIPAVILAFVDGGLMLGFLVVGFYVIIQQFENHLIYPLVVRKITGVPPLLVIISLIVGFQLAGFFGMVLAVPFATLVMELAGDIEKRKERISAGRA
ncbi:MAG: AI-2E family transporter [Patescibacteria group bacterium]